MKTPLQELHSHIQGHLDQVREPWAPSLLCMACTHRIGYGSPAAWIPTASFPHKTTPIDETHYHPKDFSAKYYSSHKFSMRTIP